MSRMRRRRVLEHVLSRLDPLLRDDRGSTSVLVGATAAVLICASAVTIDGMSFYRAKRTLQTATDLAAIAAAADPDHARTAASATLAANGVNARITTMTQGAYNPDPTVAVASRFTGNATPSNAVRLATSATAPVYLGSIFNAIRKGGQPAQNVVTIGAQAVAMRKAAAAFGIGSRVASLNGGVLNGILSEMTGSNAGLTLLDYRSLASANVDLLSFSRLLATSANLTAADYNSVLSTNVSSRTFLGTLASSATGATGSAIAYVRQAGLGYPTGSTMQPDRLFAFGPYGTNPYTVVPSLKVTTDALSLMNGMVGLASNGRQVVANIDTNVPGLTAKVALAMGSPAVSVVAGLPGASASTAQVRAQITFGIAVPGLATAQLPIAVTAARATATLTSVSCPVNGNANAVATLGVTPSVMTVGIGTLPDVTDFSAGSTMRPTQILSVLGLVNVTGTAQAAVGGTQTTPVSFTMSDASAGTIKTVTSGDIVGSLVTSLLGRLQLNVTTLGLPINIDTRVTQPLLTALNGMAPSMDAILSSLLSTLGLGIGQADIWVSDIKCGSAVLMN